MSKIADDLEEAVFNLEQAALGIQDFRATYTDEQLLAEGDELNHLYTRAIDAIESLDV